MHGNYVRAMIPVSKVGGFDSTTGTRFPAGAELVCATTLTLAAASTYFAIQYVSGTVSARLKRSELEAVHSHKMLRSRMSGTLPPHPPYASVALGLVAGISLRFIEEM
jgi:hypothetical protein